jgi:hypothetical protein
MHGKQSTSRRSSLISNRGRLNSTQLHVIDILDKGQSVASLRLNEANEASTLTMQALSIHCARNTAVSLISYSLSHMKDLSRAEDFVSAADNNKVEQQANSDDEDDVEDVVAIVSSDSMPIVDSTIEDTYFTPGMEVQTPFGKALLSEVRPDGIFVVMLDWELAQEEKAIAYLNAESVKHVPVMLGKDGVGGPVRVAKAQYASSLPVVSPRKRLSIGSMMDNAKFERAGSHRIPRQGSNLKRGGQGKILKQTVAHLLGSSPFKGKGLAKVATVY